MKKYRLSLLFLLTVIAVWITACDCAPKPPTMAPRPSSHVVLLVPGQPNHEWDAVETHISLAYNYCTFTDFMSGKPISISGTIIVTRY